MNEKQLSSSTPGMSLGDIWYVLFRHKWKIAIISILGVAVAVGLRFVPPDLADFLRIGDKRLRMSASEARLLVKYVVESKSPLEIGDKDPSLNRTSEGETALNTEWQILTSMDLAKEAAAEVGPEKILKAYGIKNQNPVDAAGKIRENLEAEPLKYSKVIRVRFSHPDPEVAQTTLEALLQCYLTKHASIHLATGDLERSLDVQTTKLLQNLQATEQELRDLKKKAGLLSVEDEKKAASESRGKIEQAIYITETDLLEARVTYSNLVAMFPSNTAQSTSTNRPLSTALISEYRRLNSSLETLSKKEQDLLGQFTPENAMVKSVQEQMTKTEEAIKKMEEEHPALLTVAETSRPGSSENPMNYRFALNAAQARVTTLESRLNNLLKQRETIKSWITNFPDDVTLGDLQRRKEIDEANYKYLKASLERARIDQALASRSVPNITKIQEPARIGQLPPKLLKIQLLIGIGSIAAAIALAFLIEMYLDQSLRRPSDIQVKVGLPLFLTIPRLHLNGKAHPALADRKRPLLAQKNDAAKPGETTAPDTSTAVATRAQDKGPLAPWDPASPLNPFSEALRDRLMTWFELNNLTHKPKLVAVTSCADGSGVSTVAAGLAASLSETGDGNVLLVDMNQQEGAAHQFHRGDLAVGIDEALEVEKRGDAKVQENLYVVSETRNEQLPSAMPKRFKNLVPRLKASDYDYIIFDMPPVSQISLTPRLARFMDMVLMVVESEQTDRDVVKRASAMLAENKAPVGVVLNKARNYVPQRLQQTI